MPRIRTIKPDFWTDTLMVQLPPLARLLYIGLWNFADDHGRLPDEPERICMEVMPREDEDEVESLVDLLIGLGRLSRVLTEKGSTYLQIEKWSQHQRVDHPSRSKFPREGSRGLASPLEDRRIVARDLGCPPGGVAGVTCDACGSPGSVHWHRLKNGKPSPWVSFSGVVLVGGAGAGRKGGALMCRQCAAGVGYEAVDTTTAHDLFDETRPDPREPSRGFLFGRGKGRGRGRGKEENQEHQPQQSESHANRPAAPPAEAVAGAVEGDGGEGVAFDRERSDTLEYKLRRAAGYENDPSPAFFVVGDIERLIHDEKFDLETEILPIVRAKALATKAKVKSWSFFIPAIREARDKRKAETKTIVSIPASPEDAAARVSAARARMKEAGFDVETEVGCRRALLAAVAGDWHLCKSAAPSPLSRGYLAVPTIPVEWLRAHVAEAENLIAIHAETMWQRFGEISVLSSAFGGPPLTEKDLNRAAEAFRNEGGAYIDMPAADPRYAVG